MSISIYQLLELLTDEQREKIANSAFEKAMDAVNSIELTAADKKEISSALSSQIVCCIEGCNLDKTYDEIDNLAVKIVKKAFSESKK